MRILLDCRMSGWSGVGRYTVGLARALAAGGEVELVQVCAAGDRPPVPPGTGAEVAIAAARPLGLRGSLELGRLVRRCRPDLVHCAHFPTPLPARGPLVVTLHDLTPLLVAGALPSAGRRIVYRRSNARAVRVAQGIIVPSRHTRADVETLFPASRGTITVTPEAADDFSSGPVGPLSPALGTLASSTYLFSMGNTKPHKDLETLLRAFARLAPDWPELHLLLAGAQTPQYVAAVLESAPPEVRERVSFTGVVTDAELRALYEGAAAFVFPSRHEGFGLPVLEAMALGAPVVCAKAASLPEVAGEAAVFFAPGNAVALAEVLSSVLGDPSLREKLILAGRARAAQFTWEGTAAMTVAVYRQALREPSRPPS
jgi:alpha-1,3-rhamnosyl/mannosyltransferase